MTPNDLTTSQVFMYRTAIELLREAFDACKVASGSLPGLTEECQQDHALSMFIINAMKTVRSGGADHVVLSEQLIFQLCEIIAGSDVMNYPTVSQDIARDIAHNVQRISLEGHTGPIH